MLMAFIAYIIAVFIYVFWFFHTKERNVNELSMKIARLKSYEVDHDVADKEVQACES